MSYILNNYDISNFVDISNNYDISNILDISNIDLPNILDISNILDIDLSNNTTLGYISYIYLPERFNLDNYNYDIEEILNRSLNDEKNKYKKVVKIETLKKITKDIKYNKAKHNIQTICPISQDKFQDNEEIIELICGHYFNKESIFKWLSNENNVCPVCRYEFEYIEIENI